VSFTKRVNSVSYPHSIYGWVSLLWYERLRGLVTTDLFCGLLHQLVTRQYTYGFRQNPYSVKTKNLDLLFTLPGAIYKVYSFCHYLFWLVEIFSKKKTLGFWLSWFPHFCRCLIYSMAFAFLFCYRFILSDLISIVCFKCMNQHKTRVHELAQDWCVGLST